MYLHTNSVSLIAIQIINFFLSWLWQLLSFRNLSILSKLQNLLVHGCYYLNTYRIGNDAISLSPDTGFCVLFSDQLATDLSISLIFSRNQLLVLLVFSIFVYFINFHSDLYLFSFCLWFYFLFFSPDMLEVEAKVTTNSRPFFFS